MTDVVYVVYGWDNYYPPPDGVVAVTTSEQEAEDAVEWLTEAVWDRLAEPPEWHDGNHLYEHYDYTEQPLLGALPTEPLDEDNVEEELEYHNEDPGEDERTGYARPTAKRVEFMFEDSEAEPVEPTNPFGIPTVSEGMRIEHPSWPESLDDTDFHGGFSFEVTEDNIDIVQKLLHSSGPFPEASMDVDCDCMVEPQDAEEVIEGLGLDPDGDKADTVRELQEAVRALHTGGCPKNRWSP